MLPKVMTRTIMLFELSVKNVYLYLKKKDANWINISAQVSESLVVNHGDFLLRDSQSCQGDFLLTCHWEQKTLHFVIRKTLVQSSETYTRVQYSLEDKAFDSLPALVHFYVGSKAALTGWSEAQIQQPLNRTLPLSYLQTAFCTAVSPPSSHREGRVCPKR